MQRPFETRTRRSCLGAALAAGVVLGAAAGADAAATVGLTVPDSIFVGETAAVVVTVDSAAVDLRGFSMVLEFDPTIVRPVSVTADSLLTNASCPVFVYWLNEASAPSGDSTAAFDGASLGCSMTGPGDLVQLRFDCLKAGTSPLFCHPDSSNGAELRDSLNQPIPTLCDSAVVDCFERPIAAEPTTWGRVKSWYRAQEAPR